MTRQRPAEVALEQGRSPEEFQRLLQAFDIFNQASASLQASYQELQLESRRLSEELASTNLELQHSLSEKESVQNYLQNILESLGNGVLVVDRDERVNICNPAGLALLDLSADRLNSRPIYRELPIPEEIKNLIADRLASHGEFCEDLQLQVLSATGPRRFLAISSSPVVDPQGRLQGITVILKDATLLKELELQTQQAQKLQAMGEMAVQLAHEIRNPLGSIELFASLLSNELKTDARLHGWSAHITTGVRFLNAIIDNMLSFSRSSGPNWSKFDLGELIRETLDFIEPIFTHRRIRLECAVDTSPISAEADREMLRQMLMNLLMNALQAMPEKGRLSVRWEDGPEQSVQIQVEDTGIGIAAEQLDRIFDPFFTTHERGTGLGLALVHQIVEKHGGQIVADSVFGKGTRFTVNLPKRRQTCNRDPVQGRVGAQANILNKYEDQFPGMAVDSGSSEPGKRT